MRQSFATLIGMSCLTIATPSFATEWFIGDNDGYGAGIADNANHPPFDPVYDGRSAAEVAATDGAQFTDTYSTSHPSYSPGDQGSVSTFIFSGLGNGWTQGAMTFDMADFQASTFGAVSVTYNGIVQNWAFNDGYPSTVVRYFDLENDVLASINALGSLTITIDRQGSSDFYGFDYARLTDFAIVNPSGVPEPGTWAMMILGFFSVGGALRRSKTLRATGLAPA